MIQTEAKKIKKVKEKNRSFNQKRIVQDVFGAIPFDMNLLSNPFLNDQQKFQTLIYKLKQYNKSLINLTANDSYEAMAYDRLFSLLSTLCNLLTKELQIDRLNQIFDWFEKQEKLIIQRKNQGVIRYKLTKSFIQDTKSKNTSPEFKKQTGYKKIDYSTMIPSQISAHQNLPYIRKWRTTHKQLPTPDLRLAEYNRKSLNFGILKYSSQKEPKKAPRITYPKIQRLKYIKQYQVQQGAQEGDKNQNPLNPQNPENMNGQQKKQGDQPVVNPQVPKQQPQQPVQDLGFGQQPNNEQPQQQQEIPQEDKLAPKLKSYIFEGQEKTKQQKTSHQRMDDRYLKVQSDLVRKQHEDRQMIELMHDWAAKKSKINKEVTKRIQNMGLNYDKYKFSYEEPEKQQPFAINDAKKYGLSKTFQMISSKPEIDLSLPTIHNRSQMYEKTLRKDKLNILKKKFGKMLDLKDYQQREVAQSMCQLQQQRKGFSDILRKHSKSKQRLKQLDEVIALKQKLARSKISVDITALSSSLCLPQDESGLPETSMPSKNLLSNPFWVQPAKKKKKK